jgi:hypothetical protein
VINEYCPHCEQACISNVRKLFLLPGTTAQCRSCGKAVSVPFYAVVAVFPLLMGYLLLFEAPGGQLGMRAIVSGFLLVLAAYFQVYLLPLVAR